MVLVFILILIGVICAVVSSSISNFGGSKQSNSSTNRHTYTADFEDELDEMEEFDHFDD
jgi:hypothetical protein